MTTRIVTCPHCKQENTVYEEWLEEDDYLVQCASCEEIIDLQIEGRTFLLSLPAALATIAVLVL